MSLEEHEGITSLQSEASDTDSLLDELMEVEGRGVPSLQCGEDGFSAADLIAAAVNASFDGVEYSDPSDTVAMVAMDTKASESTTSKTVATAVGADEAALRSPRGSSSSAMQTSAPAPRSPMPRVVRAGTDSPPRSGVPPGGGASPTTGSTRSPPLAPSSGSPPTPVQVRTSLATPGATPTPAGVPQSSRQRLAEAMGTGDIDMVDPARLAVAVGSLMEAAFSKVAQLRRQYDLVLRRLESCDASEYDAWSHRAELVLTQQSLEENLLSYLKAQRSAAAPAGSSASSKSDKETVTKRQQQKVQAFVEGLYVNVPAFTSDKRITAATPVAAIEKWVRSICDYLLSSLPVLGRLLAEAMAAYLSVGWSMMLGGSMEAPMVVGVDRPLTPMDPRPVGRHLEVVLNRTSVRRGANEPYMKWVRNVIDTDIVRQNSNEYLAEALEHIVYKVKATIDPTVVKEINRGGAEEPVLAATDVFRLLYNLLQDRGRGHLSQAKRLLAGLAQPPSLDKMSGRTLLDEIVRRAIDAYNKKLTDLAAVQSTVSMPIILFDAVLPMFPTSAETPQAAFVASGRLADLQRWRDDNPQATARECMVRLQAELKAATDSAPVAGFAWSTNNKSSYSDVAAASVESPRGRSEARRDPKSRSGTPTGADGTRRASASPTRARCRHTAADCPWLRDKGECILRGHSQAERDAAWRAAQVRQAAAPAQPGGQGGRGGKEARGKGGGGTGKGGRGSGTAGVVVKEDKAATAAHAKNSQRRAQVDSDLAEVTAAEAQVDAAVRKVFDKACGAAEVDLYAVGVGGTATGFSVPTHPMDPEFGADLAMDMPYFPSTPPAPHRTVAPLAAAVVQPERATKSVLAAPRAGVPWRARKAVVPSVRELEQVFAEVFDGVAPYVEAMSHAQQRVLLIRRNVWVTDTFARALSAISRGGGTVYKVWEDHMDAMASRTGRPVPEDAYVGGRSRDVQVPRSASDVVLSPEDGEWYASELRRLTAAIIPVEEQLAKLPPAVVSVGGGFDAVHEAAAAGVVVDLQEAHTRPHPAAVSDTGAGGYFFPVDPECPDNVPITPFHVRGATSATPMLVNRARVKQFCWPTTDGAAITVPLLGSSSRTLKTDLLSVGRMVRDYKCRYQLDPDSEACYIEFPAAVAGTDSPVRVRLEIGPEENPTVRFPPTLTEQEASALRPVDADLTELDRLLLADEQAKAQAEHDRQLRHLDRAGASWRDSLGLESIESSPNAYAVPGFAPGEEAADVEAFDSGAPEGPAVAVSRLSPKLLRQVVAVAKQKFKSASSGLSAMSVPAAVKPTPVTRFERQLQRLRDISVAQSASSGAVVPVVAPRQPEHGPAASTRLKSSKYAAAKKRQQLARRKQSLLRAREPAITTELISAYKQAIQARVASSAEPVVTIVYFNQTFKAARALLSDMPNMRVLCVGILSTELPLVVQTVQEFEGRLVYVRGHPKRIMSAKAILDCVDAAWGLGARNVMYLQAHPTCTTVSPAPFVQSAGHPHRGPDMAPLTEEAELDDNLRNGVMNLSQELSALCGPGFSAAVEQPAGIAEWVPSTVAILASSPWSRGYAPHCKLTPDPKAKVSRKLSVYFLLNVHPFDVECKQDCGHMLPSMAHHRYMIAPTKAHRNLGAQRLTGDDRVTVPRDLPYLMLGRQIRRFSTEASRPAAAEVEEETGDTDDGVLQTEAFAAAVKKLPRYPRHTLTAKQLHQACGHVNDATLLRSLKLFNGFALRRPDGKLIPGSQVVLADIQRPEVCHTCMTTRTVAAQSRQQKV